MPKPYLKRSLCLTFLIVFTVLWFYAFNGASSVTTWGYLLLAASLQTALLLSPLILLYYRLNKTSSRLLRLIFHCLAFGVLALIFSNYKLHSMYNFFIDGFVINLVTTPGGIDALGLSTSFYISALIGGTIAAISFGLAVRFIPLEKLISILPRAPYLGALLFVTLLVEGSVFAHASYTSHTEILSTASRIVWHIPITARSFLKELGVKSADKGQLAYAKNRSSGTLAYPVAELSKRNIHKPYNILWLTAESLRADMVSERVMPYTFDFANQQSWFQSHYSGGNGTRLGMFSQFYGIYGSYWFDFLYSRTAPLLIEVLQKNNYQMKAITSARFTYPEFDKTIFSTLAKEQMQEYHEGMGWQSDRKNTEDLIAFMKESKNSDKPFFAFMFFESAHANYYFPEEAVIEEDYLDDFDYLSVDIEANIGAIKNRYINASHYLDSRLGLVFDALKENKLYDNTIVIVTGDHGEEFMEKGRWGHNSTFVQEQIRVPLIIHMPGQAPKVYTEMTSHLDLPATVLSALGFEAEPSSYSYGNDLFASDYKREYTVAADWHGNVLITPRVKFILTLKGSMNSSSLTTLDDQLLERSQVSSADRGTLGKFVSEMSRFYSGHR